jgi:hypothetical protein
VQIQLALKFDQHSTKKWLRAVAVSLICVRYRYDKACQKHYKTAAPIVEEDGTSGERLNPSLSLCQ